MRKQEKEAAEARERLLEAPGALTPGTTVYTILRHVSRSGMLRCIDLVVLEDGQPYEITYNAARAMGDRIDDKTGGIRVSDCGMDMGFDLVYNLGRTLYPHGYDCPGELCQSNDHSNHPRPARVAGSMHHNDGGYAFRHRWL